MIGNLLDGQPMRSESEVIRSWINIWVSKDPAQFQSASAHPSQEDCLDDISSPAEGWRYDCTVIRTGNMATVVYLADEAAEYAARCTREFIADERDRAHLSNAQACGG